MQATLQLAEMARLGVQPDSIAATALVNACARNHRMDMALSVFDELFGELPLTLLLASSTAPCGSSLERCGSFPSLRIPTASIVHTV